LASAADARLEAMSQDENNPEGKALGFYCQEYFLGQEIQEYDEALKELNEKKPQQSGASLAKTEADIKAISEQKEKAQKAKDTAVKEREKIVAKDGTEIGKQMPARVAKDVTDLAKELDQLGSDLTPEAKQKRDQRIQRDPIGYLNEVMATASSNPQSADILVGFMTERGYLNENQAKDFKEFLTLANEEKKLQAEETIHNVDKVGLGLGGILMLLIYISSKKTQGG